MNAIVAYLSELGPWNWFIAAVILLALETAVPGVHFLWFGMAAGVIGTLMLALVQTSYGAFVTWQWQLIAFALVSIATVFWVRQRAMPGLVKSDLPDLNARAAQYVGRTFTVAESIQGGRGKIKVGDSLWTAEGPDADAGAAVRVTGFNGSVLVVELAAP